MSIFDRVKKRIERDNSGGWGENYESFFTRSKSDRTLRLPLRWSSEKEMHIYFGLSNRLYNLPTQFIHETINHFNLPHNGKLEYTDIESNPDHILHDLYSLSKLIDMEISFLIGIFSIEDKPEDIRDSTNFQLSISPILYKYKHYEIAQNIQEDDSPPQFKYYQNGSIIFERPRSFKIKRDEIPIDSKIDEQRFHMRIENIPLSKIGFSDRYLLNTRNIYGTNHS